METLYYNPGSEIELTCIIRNRSHWSSKTLWLKDNYPLDLYHRSTVRYVPQFRQNSSKFAILLIFEYNNYILEMNGVLLKSIFSGIRVRTWVQKTKNWPLFGRLGQLIRGLFLVGKPLEFNLTLISEKTDFSNSFLKKESILKWHLIGLDHFQFPYWDVFKTAG